MNGILPDLEMFIERCAYNVWTAARAHPGRRRVIKVNSRRPCESIFTMLFAQLDAPFYAVFIALKDG